MSRVKKIVNTSKQYLTLHHPGGLISSIPPGGFLRNTCITNLDEIRHHASVTMDLGEVQEDICSEGRVQLRD